MRASNWGNSDRRSQLPSNWKAIREIVGQRDSWACQWHFADGTYCGLPGNQVDHIRPSGSDDPSNLRVLCAMHHAQKSSSEGGVAKQKRLKELRSRVRREPETQAPINAAPVAAARRGF